MECKNILQIYNEDGADPIEGEFLDITPLQNLKEFFVRIQIRGNGKSVIVNSSELKRAVDNCINCG
jgi:hypothetical protein